LSSVNKTKDSNIADFPEIMKKAYDKGENEREIAPKKLIEDIKEDLRQMVQ